MKTAVLVLLPELAKGAWQTTEELACLHLWVWLVCSGGTTEIESKVDYK